MTEIETRGYRLIKLHITRWPSCAAILLVSVLGAACTSSGYRAPVEDRARVAGTVPAAPAEGRVTPTENAGKPGFVTVKPGDTLIRVAIEAGQNWRDVARWNNIDNPDSLQVGQVLRITPPATEAGVAARPVTAPRIEAKPLDGKPVAPVSASAPTTAATAPVTVPVKPTITTPPTPATAAPAPGETIAWSWPASGTVGSNFEEPRNKGIAILGKLGDPITASAFGRVIYGGALRGYGTIVLIKHNESYMSVYGNLRTVLVREGQVVTKGQRIAEMGNSESDRVQVHFEIRKDGEAIDPMRLLPAAR